MIYIGSLTRRGRYADMSDDVFNFIRDRYFVDEEVEAIVNKHWYDCKVSLLCGLVHRGSLKVWRVLNDSVITIRKDWCPNSFSIFQVLRIIYPTPEEIAKYEEEMADSDEEEEEPKNEQEEVKVNGVTTDGDDIQVVKVVDKKEDKKKKKDEDEDYPPFATYKYEVIEIEPWDSKEAKVRESGFINEKNILFQHTFSFSCW